MDNKSTKEIGRRDFLKLAGIGTVAAGAALAGCKPRTAAATAASAEDASKRGEMTYRVNHNSGDKVSLLGYGCMRWPLRKKADGRGEEVDQETVNQLVDHAIENGVNFFDTAPVYVRGWSETATGIALKRHPREKFFISTKLSNSRTDTPPTLEDGIAMYRKSLKNLQVDYIDYYFLHNIGKSIEIFEDRFIKNGLLDFLLQERQAGRIRNLGWSFHGIAEAFDHILNLDVKWDFVMIQLNYQDWQHATGMNINAQYLLGELEKRNIPVIIMEPLLGGRLARVTPQAFQLMKEMHPDDTPAQWALRYAGTPESVITVLSGMVYMEHLQENLRTYSPLKPLNDAEYKLLEKVTDILVNNDYIQCTECQYCMPCKYGIDIPGVFGHYNRIASSDLRLKSSTDANYKKARQAFLVGYDRTVPKLRQAAHCIGCDLCKPLCPQKIDIPKEMQRVDLYAENLRRNMKF